jgi:serine/threonine-protein kinase haspin
LDFDLATPASIKQPQFFLPPSLPATTSTAIQSKQGKSTAAPLSALQSLLAEADQSAPLDFTAFINSFPRNKMHGSKGNHLDYRKIGDASYSEVFGIGEVALKIMPLKSEVKPFTVDEDIEKPFESTLEDVLKEVTITKAMGDICNGFIKLLGWV